VIASGELEVNSLNLNKMSPPQNWSVEQGQVKHEKQRSGDASKDARYAHSHGCG
jgi:hypothetical protein